MGFIQRYSDGYSSSSGEAECAKKMSEKITNSILIVFRLQVEIGVISKRSQWKVLLQKTVKTERPRVSDISLAYESEGDKLGS